MKIEAAHIRNILQCYGIKEEVKEISFLLEGYSQSEPPRIKVIAKAELGDKSQYIAKCVLEEEHPKALIEEQSCFSECLRDNGIHTAKRLKYGDEYSMDYTIENLVLTVTLEEYLGEEITVINYDNVKEIAKLMADLHNISQRNNCHINNNTIWDIFDNNTDIMRGYMKFCELRKDKSIDLKIFDVDLYDNIITLCEERRAKLKDVWGKLPKYATQGDYSTNNLTRINGDIGIFDYNIAGDEVLVSDFIIEGLFITKEMDLDQELTEHDRKSLFELFIKTYVKYRELNEDELNVMNDIYAVVAPFWWTRIIFDEENSFIKLMKEKNINKVNEFLHETYEMLNGDYFN